MVDKRTRSIGIDFGTSTTLIAERRADGVPNVLPIGDTLPWMPSVVGIDAGGGLVVGEDATRLPPDRAINSVKSMLTQQQDEAVCAGGTIAVHDAVSAIVREAVGRARRIDGEVFDGAEIFVGCPALWTGVERLLLVDVLRELGLDVDVGQIIDEPVAAGLAWVEDLWLRTGRRPDGKTVVYDAGGGTLDIAYIDVAGADRPEMTVRSAEGVAEAGDVLDQTIAADLSSQLGDLNPSDDDFLQRTLLLRARELKESLTYDTERTTPLGAPFEAVLSYRRDDLERAFQPQLERACQLVQSGVRGSLLRLDQPLSPPEIRAVPWGELAADVGHVVLVGGMSQVRAVPWAMAELFPKSQIDCVERPQEAVVRGLVHGDRLRQLNLPRPPVNFCVEYLPRRGVVDADWARSHRVVYRAFTPLYARAQLARGESHLGYAASIPMPPGLQGPCDLFVRCEVPDRRRSPVTLRIRDHAGVASEVEGIPLRHDGRGPARLKLYANGDLALTSSGDLYHARVRSWPRIRGRSHDWLREIEFERIAAAGPSELRQDNWRFQ